MLLSLILTISENNVIGCNGRTPWNIPLDVQHMQSLTQNHHVIMGRRTWDALPLQPLQGRINIVLSRTRKAVSGAYVCSTLYEAIQTAEAAGETEAFVIGGYSAFTTAVHFAQCVYMTRVWHEVQGETTLELELSDFELVSEELHLGTWNLSFQRYTRKESLHE